jgi:hypothetical protein
MELVVGLRLVIQLCTASHLRLLMTNRVVTFLSNIPRQVFSCLVKAMYPTMTIDCVPQLSLSHSVNNIGRNLCVGESITSYTQLTMTIEPN